MKKHMLKILALLMCFLLMAAANGSAISGSQTGVHDGYFYLFSTDGGGSVYPNLGSGGSFSISWSNCGHFVYGKGWNPGAARTINYSGSFNVNGNGWLCIYGWTTNPLVEYYVIENYGVWMPPGGTLAGTIMTDGGTYNLYRMQRVNQPSVIGTATFYQYWSVRTAKRSSGTVTLRNHFNAWANRGWRLGTFNYQLVAVEAYQSSGSANITFWSIDPIPTPTSRRF